MKKPYRYILYVLIGMAIYFVIGADKNPEALNELHRLAPALIIGIVILLVITRYMINKQKRDDD